MNNLSRVGIAASLVLSALLAPVRLVTADSGTVAELSGNPGCEGITLGTVHVVDSVRGITSIEPPAGFNPISATNAELDCYDLPMRPTEGRALEGWLSLMRHATHYIRPGFQPSQTHHASPSAPANISGTVAASMPRIVTTYKDVPWAGYAVPASLNTGWNNLRWNDVSAGWTVPLGHNYCTSGANTSPWVGMGGDGWDGGTGTALIQAGTETNNQSPTPSVRFWWEDYNFNYAQTITGMSPKQGDSVYVDLHYKGNYYTDVFVQDVSNGQYTTWGDRRTPYVDLSSADFIVEDFPVPDFVRFGSIPFTNPVAKGTWGNGYSITKFLNQVNVTQFNLNNGNNQLIAYPSGIDSNGNFTVYSTGNAGC